MLSAEVVQGFKQNSISFDKDKVKSRLKILWQSLERDDRQKILKLAGIKKAAIERAYRLGMVSIKIISAFVIVCKVDPLYLIGKNDAQRTYDPEQLYELLSDLDYKIDKNKKSPIVRRAGAKKKEDTKLLIPPTGDEVDEDVLAKPKQTLRKPPIKKVAEKKEEVIEEPNHVRNVAAESFGKAISQLYDLIKVDGSKGLDDLTNEDVQVLLASLTLQAGFNEVKRKHLNFIKFLLTI